MVLDTKTRAANIKNSSKLVLASYQVANLLKVLAALVVVSPATIKLAR